LKKDFEFACKRKHYDKVSKRKQVKRFLWFLLFPSCVSILRDVNTYDVLSTKCFDLKKMKFLFVIQSAKPLSRI